MEKEKEFEDAVAKYAGLINKICYYFSMNQEEFQDLRQETLCNIWRGWQQFDNRSKLSTWIYRICFNTCVSFQRKESRNKNKVPIESILEIPAVPSSLALENYREMHRLISRLGYEDRAMILMWLDEKSYDEIAALIGIKRNTVATRLKRIKEKLVSMSR